MNYQKKASPDFGFRIDRNSPTPLNIQLRDGLRTYIRNHFFDPDPVLPSMLELASYFMVARNTVETALDMLEAEHLVYKKDMRALSSVMPPQNVSAARPRSVCCSPCRRSRSTSR